MILRKRKLPTELEKAVQALQMLFVFLIYIPKYWNWLKKGKVSFGHAKCLVAVTDYINQVLLAKKVAQNKLTVRDLEVEIQSMYGDKKTK